MLNEWIDRATGELNLADEVDTDLVLDLARVVAHGIERRAAPVTTYLLGIAVGRGSDPEEAAAKLARLAES